MRVFKDASGKTWTIQITVSTVKKCRAHVNVDLPGLFDDECKGLQEITNDPIRFTELLFVIVQDEAKERQVDQDAFESAMYGDALEQSMSAFLDELIDFFPEERKRNALKKILTASRELQGRIMDEAESRMAEIDIGEIATNLISSSGRLQGSSESTPTRSPAKNSS